jgi:ubiquinone/menaquinone biosynthesis C-methylase UbiE
MLARKLEPEVMDSAEDAQEYDSMDHSKVNEIFITDLQTALSDWSLKRPVQRAPNRPLHVLDLGAGTAQIPIELARRVPNVHITAVDAAASMLALANKNIADAGLADRITPTCADAKQLPFDAQEFDIVISNSILHHIPDPQQVIAETIRVTALGGLLFHRDLARPDNETALNQIVDKYAADSTPYQRRLFAESLHAALTLEEMAAIVASFGFGRTIVCMTSDRHWTWIATNS